jgi:hypothetical protein
MSHTPGPWQVMDSKTLLHIERQEDGVHVCSMPKIRMADAQLIAAAPDLLAALKRYGASCMVNDVAKRCGACVGCTAYAAITKAEGK